ncbi:glycoside hydrolase family 19 protein [Micromonospora sp. NPDC050397]|uniref:glycoside hydrolase family 19 protein n=1 Tax=Micromonospora sp. NPDC050397 TaxID=3364279 RepID=UPI00384ED56C
MSREQIVVAAVVDQTVPTGAGGEPDRREEPMVNARKLARPGLGQTPKPPDAGQIVGIVVSLLGILPVLAVVLICLVGIVVVTGNSSFSSSISSIPLDGPSSSPGLLGDGIGDIPSALIGGNGKGQLAANAVPRPDLVAALEAAGTECDLISPIVLAAQIQVESQFNPDAVGSNGEQGISQLPVGVFEQHGEDDDDSGKAAVQDPVDSIHAQARYLCALGEEVKQLLTDHQLAGDRLTLTLWAWDLGIDSVKTLGLLPVPVESYPFAVRAQFATFTSNDPAATTAPTPTPVTTPGPPAQPVNTAFDQAVFNKMFPNAQSFYTYSAMTAAMAKYPAFASGAGDVGRREIAAFLANVDRESGGLRYVEELNQSAWGNYCNTGVSYGCPAGRTAYHGRGPIQLSWNTNYKAAGDSLGVDLLHRPDLVSTDASIAWGTALWFWMTQSGAGPITSHAAITGDAGFAGTIRSINGVLECNGGNPSAVDARVSAYLKFCAMLNVTPGDRLRC